MDRLYSIVNSLILSHRPLPLAPPPRLPENVVGIDPLLQQKLPLGLEGVRRADADALAAEDAGGVHHAVAHEGADQCVEAAAVEVQRKGVLRVFGANLYTAPAVDALVVVA